MNNYQRSTTRSRREANKPNFVHYSKRIDEAGNYTVHFKTKVLSHEEAQNKLMKRKWFRRFMSYDPRVEAAR